MDVLDTGRREKGIDLHRGRVVTNVDRDDSLVHVPTTTEYVKELNISYFTRKKIGDNTRCITLSVLSFCPYFLCSRVEILDTITSHPSTVCSDFVDVPFDRCRRPCVVKFQDPSLVRLPIIDSPTTRDHDPVSVCIRL